MNSSIFVLHKIEQGVRWDGKTVMKKFIINTFCSLLFLSVSHLSNAKVICCRNWYNWGGVPYSLDKCDRSSSTSTNVGADVYVEINCFDPGNNSCPSCSVNRKVIGVFEEYTDEQIMAYVYQKIEEGDNNGHTYFLGDAGVELWWQYNPDGSLMVKTISNG